MDLQELRDKLQEYLDEAPLESDNFLEGLDVTHGQAKDLFQDFLLYVAGGDIAKMPPPLTDCISRED